MERPPRIGTSDPLELVRLAGADDGPYEGLCVEGASGRVFGGHVLAHVVRAASLASGGARPVDALHVSFVRPAVPTRPLVYRADVVKSGRSLDVVGIRAEQRGATMLLGVVTMHEPEPSVEFGVVAPRLPGPDALEGSDYRPPGTSADVRAPFELRYVPGTGEEHAHEDVWIRTRALVGSDAQPDHAALLAYGVDFLVTRAAHVGLPPSMAGIGASLDHAMWFHRPFRADEWLLVSSTCTVFAGSRSLSTSRVFDTAGRLVATASQEALIRVAEETRA